MLRVMRGRSTASFFVVIVTALCLFAGTSAWAQEDPADIATARELFREGLELSKEEKWEEARVKLGQSLALKQAALTFYTLAVADKNTSHLVAALEHFRGFLAQPVTDKTEGFVEPARQAVAELEKRVAGATITVKPQGSPNLSVRLDGEDLPLSALGRRRLLDPGEHVVTAKADGFAPRTQRLVVAEGENREVVLALQRGPQDGVPEPGAEPEFPLVPVILIGSGAVVAGVGLALGIVGVGEAKDAPTQDGKEADAALKKTIAGDVLMGVGGATAGVGLVLLILHFVSEEDTAADPVAIRPWAAGDTIGVELRF